MMYNEQYVSDMNFVAQILESYDTAFSVKNIKVDHITNALIIGRKIYFTRTYPVKGIRAPNQNWGETLVLEMLGLILRYLDKPLIETLSRFDHTTIDDTDKRKALEIIPPIILSTASDGSVSILDGNHRYALAKIMHLEYIPAFIIAGF